MYKNSPDCFPTLSENFLFFLSLNSLSCIISLHSTAISFGFHVSIAAVNHRVLSKTSHEFQARKYFLSIFLAVTLSDSRTSPSSLIAGPVRASTLTH